MKISLRFFDPQPAGELVAASPCPAGVIIWGPAEPIEVFAPSGRFSEIIIDFPPEVTTALLATWIVNVIRWDRHSTRINGKEVALTKEAICQLIEEEIAKRAARKAQEIEPRAMA